MMKMHDLLTLAKLGAPVRLQQIQAEAAQLQKLIGGPRGESPRPRRRSMSAAARKAVSVRMRKYWAGRRNAQK